MTRVLSATLAPHDINVNCVCPGGVATDMLHEVAVALCASSPARPPRTFSGHHQFAAGPTHRAGRGRARDILPPERRRHYHPGAGHQRRCAVDTPH